MRPDPACAHASLTDTGACAACGAGYDCVAADTALDAAVAEHFKTSTGQVWREINAIRAAAALDPVDPGTPARHVRELELTPARRKSLTARIDEHGAERVLLAWRWVHTSRFTRAEYLRRNGYDVPETFLRPANCASYVTLSETHGWPETSSTPSLTGPALAAWEGIEALLREGYHPGSAPERLDPDDDRDRLLRHAITEAGGWRQVASCDRFSTPTVKAAFCAAFDRNLQAAK